MVIMSLCKVLLLATCVALGRTASEEAPHTRRVLYVGGEYTSDGSGGHIFHNQMYVEHLTPVNTDLQTAPIVMIHGQGQTGTVRTPPPPLRSLKLRRRARTS